MDIKHEIEDISISDFDENSNDNIKLILGDYKKALIKLALPLLLSTFVMASYIIMDAIWVAGLGARSLAALGFVTPVYMFAVSISNGIGAGVTSLISRCIGARDKKESDKSATQALTLALILSIILTVFLLLIQEPLLYIMGAGSVLSEATAYSTIIFAGLITLMFSGTSMGILRAEGDVKRAVYVMIFTCFLNAVLDPIFIYVTGWGIAGAALATIISSLLSIVLFLYWIIVKKDTFVKFKVKYLKPNWRIMKDILVVGIPSTMETILFSLLVTVLNLVLVFIGTLNDVAVLTAGFRILLFAMIPLTALASSTLIVTATTYGGKDYKKLSNVLSYSTKLSFTLAIILGVLIFIFAPQITFLFTYADETRYLIEPIVNFLRVMSLFIIFDPIGAIASSYFQGMGKGFTSLALNILRYVIIIFPICIILAIVFHLKSMGIWYGIALGNFIGIILAGIYTFSYSKKLLKYNQ